MRNFVALVILAALSSCTFSSTAEHWNQRVGPDGEVVYVKSTTNIGMNLGIVIPLLGSTTLDSMVGTLTEEIGATDGDNVRIYQTTAENYWYGFPPFTWIFTPVITTVSAEYRPSASEIEATKRRDEGADG